MPTLLLLDDSIDFLLAVKLKLEAADFKSDKLQLVRKRYGICR